MNYSEILPRLFKLTNVPQAVCDINYFLCDFWEDNSGPIMKGYLNSPLYYCLIVLVYLPCVFLGQSFMKDRQPIDVGFLMKWYNITNIVINGILFVGGLYITTGTFNVWLCQDFKSYLSPNLVILGALIFLGLKVYDLTDTVFFVLRKKNNQITPLHVVHHAFMPIGAYVFTKLAMSPSAAVVVMFNSFVHIILYYYYHLTAQGKSVWWKKYITQLQIVQFVIFLVHGLHTFFIGNCSYPRWAAAMEVVGAIYFIIVFSLFYVKTYMNKKLDVKDDRQLSNVV